LKKKISNSATKTKDQTTKYHLEDLAAAIENVLSPKIENNLPGWIIK